LSTHRHPPPLPPLAQRLLHSTTPHRVSHPFLPPSGSPQPAQSYQ